MSRFTSEHLDKAHLFRYDTVTGYVYLGYADLGVTDSDLRWSIKRVDLTNGAIQWASGVPDFKHAWTNRASYTYS